MDLHVEYSIFYFLENLYVWIPSLKFKACRASLLIFKIVLIPV